MMFYPHWRQEDTILHWEEMVQEWCRVQSAGKILWASLAWNNIINHDLWPFALFCHGFLFYSDVTYVDDITIDRVPTKNLTKSSLTFPDLDTNFPDIFLHNLREVLPEHEMIIATFLRWKSQHFLISWKSAFKKGSFVFPNFLEK